MMTHSVHPLVQCLHIHDADKVERIFQSCVRDLHESWENARKCALAQCMQVSSVTYQLAKHPTFCRLLQAAFEMGVLPESVTDQLFFNLLPNIVELANHPSANFVLQRIIDVKPPATAELLVWKVQATPQQTTPSMSLPTAVLLAKNRHGCRILERLIEHAGAILEKYGIVRSLVTHAETLSKHPFGNFVIQRLIEHMEAARNELFEMLKSHMRLHASHRTASHVLQLLLENLDEARCQHLMERLLEEGVDGCSLEDVMTTRYGSFVVLQVVQSEYPGSAAVRDRVQSNEERLRKSEWAMKNLMPELPRDFFQRSCKETLSEVDTECPEDSDDCGSPSIDR